MGKYLDILRSAEQPHAGYDKNDTNDKRHTNARNEQGDNNLRDTFSRLCRFCRTALAPIASSPRHCSNEDQRCVQARRINMSFLGSDTTIEVKRRGTGFARLYDWLNDRDVLIGKADRQEPSVVLCMSIAKSAA